MEKEYGRLVLGLDIGITSVGWGIIDIDHDEFVDYGVRLFKEGTAENNLSRRTKRSTRRLIRRKRNRISDMKHYLISIGLMNENFEPLEDPYSIRVRGLTHKLTDEELCTAILHLTKRRGSCFETAEEDDEGLKGILSNNTKLLAQGKYVCQIQMDRLNDQGKIRGSENNFKTEQYVDELRQILSNQELSEETNEKIIEIVSRRRDYYEGPGSEKSPTPYGRYYIENGELKYIDMIEKMRGRCSVYPDELRAPKLSYSAELFNLLNDLNNLKIRNEKIDYETKVEIIDFVNNNGGITIKQLLKILDANEEEVSGFRVDKNNKNIITEFKGYKEIQKIFKKHKGLDLIDHKQVVDDIAEILTQTKGIEERKLKIKEQHPEIGDAILDDLSVITKFTAYHSLSFKALRELNVELIKTNMNQMQILHELDKFNKNRKSMEGQVNILPDDEAILSPVAKRAQRETFKVINAVRKKYGELDSIVIEMTRDKNSSDQKKRINQSQKYYEERNKQIDAVLKDCGKDPAKINGKTKEKVRYYIEQDGKSAYTLQPLDLRLVINDPSYTEIDHIIPISISLDDSINNKVLITRLENQHKGNLTPIDAYQKGKFSNSGCDENTYITYVKNNKQYNKKKKSYLLYNEDITKFSNMEEFINRNLVDTSYACRTVLNTLQYYYQDNGIDTKVHTIKGSATSAFRKRIHLEKVRDDDYFHHAIDALIVASLKKLNLLHSYLMKYDYSELYNEETGEVKKIPDENKYLDPRYIQFVARLKTVYEDSFRYNTGVITKEEMHYPLIKVSHKVDTKPNRQVADETIYSTRVIDNNEMLIKKYKDIYDPKFTQLTNDIVNAKMGGKVKYEYLMQRNDPKTFAIIEEIILNHFENFRNALDEKNKPYYKVDAKGNYSLNGENPLTSFKEEHGKIRKYSKKGNGPEITTMKYYCEKLGNHCDITKNYNTKNKRVVLLQVSPYRTDFYVSPKGKYNFVTIRYNNVFYSKSKEKYVIDKNWYQSQKDYKKIGDDWQFVCSMHHDELIGITKRAGTAYIYDESCQKDEEGNPRGEKKYHNARTMEILKFTATNNDAKGTFEVKPINNYCKKRLMPSVGTCIKITKYATDVLGNLYEVKENHLKLEFE